MQMITCIVVMGVLLALIGGISYEIRKKSGEPYQVLLGRKKLGNISAIGAIILCFFLVACIAAIPFYGINNYIGNIHYAWEDTLTGKFTEYDIDVCNGNLLYYANSSIFKVKPDIAHYEYYDYSYESDYDSDYDSENISLDEAMEYTYEPSPDPFWDAPEIYAQNKAPFSSLIRTLIYVFIIAIVFNIISHLFRFNTGWNIVGIISSVVMGFTVIWEGMHLSTCVPYVYNFVENEEKLYYFQNASGLLWGFYIMLISCVIILLGSILEIYNKE